MGMYGTHKWVKGLDLGLEISLKEREVGEVLSAAHADAHVLVSQHKRNALVIWVSALLLSDPPAFPSWTSLPIQLEKKKRIVKTDIHQSRWQGRDKNEQASWRQRTNNNLSDRQGSVSLIYKLWRESF